MPGQLARLALILAAVDACAAGEDAPDRVEDETIRAAADLVDYYKAHARRAYRRMARGRRDLAVRILAALKERGPLTQDAIYSNVLHHNTPAERVRGALEELETAGLVVRDVRKPAGGGRPATEWRPA